MKIMSKIMCKVSHIIHKIAMRFTTIEKGPRINLSLWIDHVLVGVTVMLLDE